MINREEGLIEIYERIKVNRKDMGIVTFKRTPTTPVKNEDLPCIFMIEGVDNIFDRSSRGTTGYPAKRILEVTLELVTDGDTNIRQLYSDLRRAVFSTIGSDPVVYDSVIAKNTFINENRTEGPIGYGLPDILSMSLVLDLVYVDTEF